MLQDIDGNIYTSVVRAGKEWLVENYKTTHFRNGQAIKYLPNSVSLDLFSGWVNEDMTSFTTSGHDITYALGAVSEYCYCELDEDLSAGDTLHFNFDITLISLNLPRAVLIRNGSIIGSTLITVGTNSLNFSIATSGTYRIGFQAVTGGSEFSVVVTVVGSAFFDAWEDDMEGAYCWSENDTDNKPVYGALYNGYLLDSPLFPCIIRDGVQESGWRVPTDDDWNDVITEQGGASVAGGKMKESGTVHWQSPNTGADNASGLTLLPGGLRFTAGTYPPDGFAGFGQFGNYWSSTEDIGGNLSAMIFAYNSANAYLTSGNQKMRGKSVRLVRTFSPPVVPPEIGPGKVLTVGYEAVEFFDKFNITYSIGDIRDLSQGSSDKSYTIELPLTKKNRHILKHINQVDVKSEPTKRARIYMDELIIIQGKIFVLTTNDTHAKILINSDDWIEALKSKKMAELDLSAYDHLLTNANVEASWSTADAFYRYPMIDFGALASGETGLTANWTAVDFIPMIRVIDLITKILYPFTIISDNLDDQYIKDLYILGREKIADANFVNGKHLELQGDAYGDNTNTSSVASGALGVAILTSHVIKFNDTITDEAPAWDAITGIYTVPETGTYRFKATLALINTGNTAPFAEMAGQCTIYLLQSGSASNVLNTYSRPTGMLTENIIIDSGYVYLVANDEVHFEITCYSRAKNNGGSPANLTVGLDVTSKLELIWNNPTRYKGINDTIKLSEYMPEMSQADFLGAIRDVFDLRFWMDKSRQNLYIESWDALHTPDVKDISSLVDYASLSEYPAEMISNNYNRNIKFKWKDDSGDEAINEHLRMYDSPLTKSLVLTSQFCKDGEEVKEHQWSSIVEGYNLTLVDYTKQVPRIWDHLIMFSEIDFNRKVNFNTRLVHWDGYVTCVQSWVFDSASKDHYPKISGVSWPYVYSQFWQKIFHKIDKGKLYPIKIKVKPGFLTQFMTVINNGDAEAFRPIYKVNIDGVDNYFRLQRVTSDGDSAELELFIE